MIDMAELNIYSLRNKCQKVLAEGCSSFVVDAKNLQRLLEIAIELSEAETEIKTAVAAAYQDCVEICHKQAEALLSPKYAANQPFSSMPERFACSQIATTIEARALAATSELGSVVMSPVAVNAE